MKELVVTEVAITCPYCEWGYSEPVAESVIPLGLMASFSDPDALKEIMHTQRLERIAAAVTKHFREAHPHLARVQ